MREMKLHNWLTQLWFMGELSLLLEMYVCIVAEFSPSG